MTNYINQTRTDAIITINVESAPKIEEVLQLSEPGNKVTFSWLSAGIGLNDVEVPTGKELRVGNNAVVTFIAARSMPR